MKKILSIVLIIVTLGSVIPTAFAATSKSKEISLLRGCVTLACEEYHGKDYSIQYSYFCHYDNIDKAFPSNKDYPIEDAFAIRKVQVPDQGYICIAQLEDDTIYVLLTESFYFVGILSLSEENDRFSDFDDLYRSLSQFEVDGVVPIKNSILQNYAERMKGLQKGIWPRMQLNYYAISNLNDVKSTIKKNVWYVL